MTNPNSTINDDQIIAIAKKIDTMIMDIGEEFKPSGIEFAAIALGRLMVFTQQVGCFDKFSEMMSTVAKLAEPEALSKTDDFSQENA